MAEEWLYAPSEGQGYTQDFWASQIAKLKAAATSDLEAGNMNAFAVKAQGVARETAMMRWDLTNPGGGRFEADIVPLSALGWRAAYMTPGTTPREPEAGIVHQSDAPSVVPQGAVLAVALAAGAYAAWKAFS